MRVIELGEDLDLLFEIFYDKISKYDYFHTYGLDYSEWNHSFNKRNFIHRYQIESSGSYGSKAVYLGVMDDNNKCVGFMYGYIFSDIAPVSSIISNSGIDSSNPYYNQINKAANILGIYVDEDVRGQGVSELLYNYYFQKCLENQCIFIGTSIMSKNIGSLIFHQRMGFVTSKLMSSEDFINIYKILN